MVTYYRPVGDVQMAARESHTSAAALTVCYFNFLSCLYIYTQGFYSNRIGNSTALFWTRGFGRTVQFGQTTLNSDVIMLCNIGQLLELK